MAERKVLEVSIPEVVIPAIHQEYDIRSIAEFFDEEDKRQKPSFTTGRKLAAKKELVMPAAQAERDSKWAQANGIPEGTNYVLFIGDDGIIRYVVCHRDGLGRNTAGLGYGWGNACWVACPRK